MTTRADTCTHDSPPHVARLAAAAGWCLLLACLLPPVGCSVSSLNLESKKCPCAEGWTCDTRVARCVLGELVDVPPNDMSVIDATDAGRSSLPPVLSPLDASPADKDTGEPPFEPIDSGTTVSDGAAPVVTDAGIGRDAEADAAAPCLNALLPGQRLYPGDYRCSADGQYRFGLSLSGELELVHADVVVWSAQICCGMVRLAMQTDGNLVVYGADNLPRFASNTDGNPGAWLSVENDGRAVVWLDGRVLWSTDKIP